MASNQDGEFERAYEDLRMKTLQSGDSIFSRSELVFMSAGMRGWLHAVADISSLPGSLPQPAQQISIPSGVGQPAIRLLTDMALNTWKEAG